MTFCALDLTLPEATSARAMPKPDTGSADGQAVIQRHGADGLEVAVEHCIDNDGAKSLRLEIGELRANRVRTARQRCKLNQPDLGLALARQHPHQIGIMHRVERMILQRTFVQRHLADEQIALIDGAAGFRETPASPARSRRRNRRAARP